MKTIYDAVRAIAHGSTFESVKDSIDISELSDSERFYALGVIFGAELVLPTLQVGLELTVMSTWLGQKIRERSLHHA